jgi:COP9 signalosome complex subunit 1
LYLPTLQAYANNYTGHAKIDRLLFMSKTSIFQHLEVDALKLAVDEVKKVIISGKDY